jgi:hypothetical protein
LAAEAFSDNGTHFFIKGADGEAGRTRLQREWTNLQQARELLPRALTKNIISPVGQITDGGWSANIYVYFGAKSIEKLEKRARCLALRRAVEWITALAAATQHSHNWSWEDDERSGSLGAAVLGHGDFTVNNLLWDTDNQKLFITDWEMMEEHAVPMYDLVDLIISDWLTTIRGKTRMGLRPLLKRNRGTFVDYLTAINLDIALCDPLVDMFFRVAAEREAVLDKIPIEKTLYQRLRPKTGGYEQ